MGKKSAAGSRNLATSSFDKICRVCLGENKGLKVFEEVIIESSEEEENLSLLEGFKKYFGFEVQLDDEKPKKICKSCIPQAKKCLQFSQKLYQSDQFLDKFLLESKEERIGKVDLDVKDLNIPLEDIKEPKDEEDFEVDQVQISVELDDIKDNGFEEDFKNDSANDMGDDLKCEDNTDEDEDFVPNSQDGGDDELFFKQKLKKGRKVKTVFLDGERFVCTICDHRTDDVHEIIEHYDDAHSNVKKCIICEKNIVKKQLMRYHMSTHSRVAEQCKPCRQYFRSTELKEEHMKNYDHSNPLVCHICNKKFALKSRRDKHMIAHFGEKKFQCAECGARFLYQTSYERHYRKHFGKDFLCYICGKEFTTNFNVKQHIAREHMGEKPEKPSSGPPKKRTYKKRVSLMGEVECEYCGDILPSKPSYVRHRQNHPEFMDYPCRYCKAQFTAKEDLKHHVETRHKRFVCTYCGKGFPFKCQLDVHHVNHRDLNLTKLSCSICGLPRRNQKDLNTHMLGHTGEKPIVCEICGKTFRQQAHLNVHMYQHTGKKPHKCDMCGKTFTFRCNLVSHIRVHTGEKPFQCSYCDKAFRDSTILHKHKKKTHPIQLEKEINNAIPGVPNATTAT